MTRFELALALAGGIGIGQRWSACVGGVDFSTDTGESAEYAV